MRFLMLILVVSFTFIAKVMASDSGVVISIGCGNGLIGNRGDLVVMQEISGGGRLLGVFSKKDADKPQAHVVTLNIGSGNGLIGKPGDIWIVQEAPGGGIPLGSIPTNEGKFDPDKQIKITIHRGNGLIGRVGDLAVHQPGPFGGSPLATYPRDGGKKCNPMKLKISRGDGTRGAKTDIVVIREIEGYSPKVLTKLTRNPWKSIDASDRDEGKVMPAY